MREPPERTVVLEESFGSWWVRYTPKVTFPLEQYVDRDRRGSLVLVPLSWSIPIM